MELETFLNLSTGEVARQVRAAGPLVCVFPVNGTRRWFQLEQPNADYLEAVVARHIEIYQLLFEHGLDTLLLPVFGPDIVERGAEYMQMAAEGLVRLATDPAFLNFYAAAGARVRFYGDYRQPLASTACAPVLEAFDRITAQTQANQPRRLFFGLFANDAAETTAELAVRHFQQHGRVPNRRELVKLYYGDDVEPASLFIGFDKPSAYDMPLLDTGQVNLYFTASPSLYFTARQLRLVLYDHLYVRPQPEPDYEALPPGAWETMRQFYQANRDVILGVGDLHNGLWYPRLPGL